MLFSIALALLASLTAFAQDTTKTSYDNTKAARQENQEKSASQPKIVTGCPTERRPPGPVFHHGEDGKSFDLLSSTVKLADHVGHKVTVTGSLTREAKAEEKKEGQVEKAAGKEGLGELRVSSLKMVSQSCAE